MASNGNSDSDPARKDKLLFESDRRVELPKTGESERRNDTERRKFLRPTTKLRKMGFAVALVIFLLVIIAGFLMR